MADRLGRQLTCLFHTWTRYQRSIAWVICLLVIGSLSPPLDAQHTPLWTNQTNQATDPSSAALDFQAITHDHAEPSQLSRAGAHVVFDPLPHTSSDGDAMPYADLPQTRLLVPLTAALPGASVTPSDSLAKSSLATPLTSSGIDDLIDTILSHDAITSAVLLQEELTIGEGFTLERTPSTSHPRTQSDMRVDRWSRSVFADDAALLTPFARGSEVISWNLSETITLAGVGSRRVWDARDRAFVLSAEAGFSLTPTTGLQVGYQLLQTSLNDGVVMPDLSRDALFARFQLRF